MKDNKNEIVLFENQDVKLEVNVKDETVWLNLEQMSDLFKRDKSVISRHINNIYKEQELDKRSTVANFATVQNESGRMVTRNIDYYNLDVIISVGYRVKSKEGTKFRQWANKSIEEKAANFLYLIVKNHVFIDGNKRIAATLFIYFLNYYGILYKNNQQIIDNNTLTALTLLIAESNPKEKDVIIDLVMNFLNND